MNRNKKVLVLRGVLLAGFLIFISLAAYMHQAVGGGSDGAPSIHALCPFGGLESLYSLFAAGTFIQKIFSAAVALLVITLILGLLFRRSFCGLICPLGTIQELFGWLGRKLHLPLLAVPVVVDRPLRMLKYGVLIATIAAAWMTAGLWISPYDPWAAYAHLFAGIPSVITEFPIGFALLVFTLIGALFYERIFCKYLCPMGALLGLISFFSPSKILRNDEVCIHCGHCKEKCPMNIDVPCLKEVRGSECINCQLCLLSCPQQGALENKLGKRKFKPLVVILIVMAVFFGGIGIARLAGFYQDKPAQIKAGEIMSVEDIKGYMTLQEVSDGLQLPVEKLYGKLGIGQDVPPSTTMKELQTIVPGLDTEVAREKLKE